MFSIKYTIAHTNNKNNTNYKHIITLNINTSNTMFPIPPQFSPQFFWTMVVATQVFIEGDEDCFDAEEPQHVKPVPRWVKEMFDDIRRTTGCVLTLCDPQPEFQRPNPFYYIQGTWEGVIRCQFLIQKMMCEYTAEKCSKFDERYDLNKTWRLEGLSFNIPQDVPLWKCLNMVASSRRCDQLEMLNSWCVEGTKVEIRCRPQMPGEIPCPCERGYNTLKDEEKCQLIHIWGPEKTRVEKSHDIILAKIFRNLNSK